MSLRTGLLIAAVWIYGLAAQTAPQTPAKQTAPPAPIKGPAAAPSMVDNVIQMVKDGSSESFVIKWVQKQNKPVNLTAADTGRLKKAGVSENIMEVMMDPTATPAAPKPPQVGPPPVTPPPTSGPSDAPPAAACPPPASVAPVAGAQKRRLAVSAFDYSAVKTQVTAMFNNDVNIGQGIRAMLTAKMGQSKSVVLLEREKLEQLQKEQDRGNTNRVAQGTKAKTGKLVGADAMLFGDIVIFGQDNTNKKSGLAGVLGGIPSRAGVILGGAASARKTVKAVVAISLRIVDTETGEQLAAAEARGESTRTSTDWGAVAGSWKGGAATSGGMTSSDFAETIIGEATNNAVAQIVEILESKAPELPAKARSVEGRVANFDGCTLYLSIGASDGVQVGDVYEIHKIIKDVVDLETKEVLDKQTVKVGEFVVSTARDKVSIGQYGGEPLDPSYGRGYAARLVTK